MDEIKLGQAQHRGVRAQELLDNSLLNEAFAEIENFYLKQWRSGKVLDQMASDVETREACWRAVQTLDAIRNLLKRHVTNGRIAAEDLRRLSEERENHNE